MFEPPEALPIHTLSKLHFLIHELYLTKLLSFLELLHCGTHCHPLLPLNPTICHLLNLISTNLILSPFLLKLSLIFSVFPLSGLCYRPYGLSPTLLTKKKTIEDTERPKYYVLYCMQVLSCKLANSEMSSSRPKFPPFVRVPSVIQSFTKLRELLTLILLQLCYLLFMDSLKFSNERIIKRWP